MEFIYNDSRESSGHWHIVDGEAEVTVVPAASREVEREKVDFNRPVREGEEVDGVEYYAPSWRRPGDYSVYPILGKVTATLTTAEHTRAEAHVICTGEPEWGTRWRIKATGLRSSYGSHPEMGHKKNLGKHLTLVDRRPQVMYMKDPATPPEPLCLHCARKAGLL